MSFDVEKMLALQARCAEALVARAYAAFTAAQAELIELYRTMPLPKEITR